MNEPIKYREYVIKNLQLTTQKKWWYQHCEYTGAEDKRYGQASTLDEAKSDIDNLTIEEQEHTIEVLRKKHADAMKSLSAFVRLEKLIEYPREVSEAHVGEAMAVSAALARAKEICSLQN